MEFLAERGLVYRLGAMPLAQIKPFTLRGTAGATVLSSLVAFLVTVMTGRLAFAADDALVIAISVDWPPRPICGRAIFRHLRPTI